MSTANAITYVRNIAKESGIDLSDRNDEDLTVFALDFLCANLDDAFESDLDNEDAMTIRIAGHEVEYWYDDEWKHEITDDDSDFEHIQEMLIDDCVEGELVTYDNDTEETRYGWWKKV